MPDFSSNNGTNDAKNSVVTFHQTGNYMLRVMITDAGGLWVLSQPWVYVNPTVSVVVAPSNRLVVAGRQSAVHGHSARSIGNPGERDG